MEWWEREKLNQLEIAKIKSTIMKTKEQTYITPQVERIELDNENSLTNGINSCQSTGRSTF